MLAPIVTEEPLLTFKEVMTYLKVSRSTIYRLLASGQLPGYKVGTSWRFHPADCRACVKTPDESPQRVSPRTRQAERGR